MSMAMSGEGEHPSTRIVRLANQIATAFQLEADPEAATADHIAKFWDPRMRAQLKTAVATASEDLSPIARAAATKLGLGG